MPRCSNVVGSWEWIVQWLAKFHRPPCSTEVDEETPTVPQVAVFEALLVEAERTLESQRDEKATIEEQLVKERKDREQLIQELSAAEERLQEERENGSRIQKDLHEVQKRLETESGELRKAKVFLEREKQELVEANAEVGRLKEIAQQRNHDSLLLRGINVQASFPTLPEINARIGSVLKGTVREWVHRMSTIHHACELTDLPVLLAKVFLECQAVVIHHHRIHIAYFHGNRTYVKEDKSDAMEKEAETFMLKHMRRHYVTLYPLSPGQDLDTAIQWVICQLANMFSRKHNEKVEMVCTYLFATGIQDVIKEYLHILVGVTLHPPASFSDGCGRIDAFHKKKHNNSIDGDVVRSGDACVVVFPGLVGELEVGEGPRSIGKMYILPRQEASGVPVLKAAI